VDAERVDAERQERTVGGAHASSLDEPERLSGGVLRIEQQRAGQRPGAQGPIGLVGPVDEALADERDAGPPRRVRHRRSGRRDEGERRIDPRDGGRDNRRDPLVALALVVEGPVGLHVGHARARLLRDRLERDDLSP